VRLLLESPLGLDGQFGRHVCVCSRSQIESKGWELKGLSFRVAILDLASDFRVENLSAFFGRCANRSRILAPHVILVGQVAPSRGRVWFVYFGLVGEVIFNINKYDRDATA
jgi:hypothetical protein